MTNRSLLLHIGSGKTGSSSIQKTLEVNRPVLQAAGFRYLGIMLEYASHAPPFEWRIRGGSNRFFNQGDDETRKDEIYQVLAAELAETPEGGTLVWSNEWMFGRHTLLFPALKKLQHDGVNVSAICYLRRHDRYATSAYKQWAIKNKQNDGRILRFRDWASRSDTMFYPKINPWVDKLGEKLALFNYEEIEDVVSHFVEAAGMPALKLAKDNVSPRNEMLALWGLFNNRLEGPVPPRKFENYMQFALPHQARVEMPPLTDLLPNDDELRQFQQKHQADAGQINELLVQYGQPPMDTLAIETVSSELDSWKMTCLLASMLFGLGEKVKEQRDQIAALEKRLAEIAPQASESALGEG